MELRFRQPHGCLFFFLFLFVPRLFVFASLDCPDCFAVLHPVLRTSFAALRLFFPLLRKSSPTASTEGCLRQALPSVGTVYNEHSIFF